MPIPASGSPHLSSLISIEHKTRIKSISNYLQALLILHHPSSRSTPQLVQAIDHHQNILDYGSLKFQATSQPSIAIHDYLIRLIDLCPIPIDGLLLGLIYLDRITSPSTTHPHPSSSVHPDPIPIHPLTIHRLILSSILLGNKFISERPITRRRLSKVAGVSELELDDLERELLKRLKFKLCWSDLELDRLSKLILNHLPSSSLHPHHLPQPHQSLPSTTIIPSLPSSPKSSSSSNSSISPTTTSSISSTPSISLSSSSSSPSEHHQSSLSSKPPLHRSSFPNSSISKSSSFNKLSMRRSATGGIVFFKSQFIDSNLLTQKSYSLDPWNHDHHSHHTQKLFTSSDSNQTTFPPPSSHSIPPSKIIVTKLEHNQIKVCHAQIF